VILANETSVSGGRAIRKVTVESRALHSKSRSVWVRSLSLRRSHQWWFQGGN